MGTIVKYVWLDEDGERVSPLHAKLGTALNFINGWDTSYARVAGRFGDVGGPRREIEALTKTGKRPQTLVRVEISEQEVDLTEGERLALSAFIGTST